MYKRRGKRNRIDTTTCLTFSSDSEFSLSVANPGWDGVMEYATPSSDWTTWDGSAVSGKTIYVRGSGNTKVTGAIGSTHSGGPNGDYAWSFTGDGIPEFFSNLNDITTLISCDGNIETLLDYATVLNGGHPVMADYCYATLFCNAHPLISAPELPATILSKGCYAYMFCFCMTFTQAPELPATTLAEDCYVGMFSTCRSLTQAPELPATILAKKCYSGMFYQCDALVTAPELPVTTLADSCYGGMFQYCISLPTAPTLPATTLTESCYAYMFYGCFALTKAPELPALTLTTRCYDSMFERCSSLKFSSTKTEEYTQPYRIPTSGEGTTAENALTDMFDNTGGTFTGTPEINTTYYLHKDCSIVGGGDTD